MWCAHLSYMSLHGIKIKPVVAMTKAVTLLGVLRFTWNLSYRRKRSQDFHSILSC